MNNWNGKISAKLENKLAHLRQILQSYQRVLIAYSGGVDSMFLLKVAVDTLGAEQVLAGIGVSESLAQTEYDSALEMSRSLGVPVEEIHPREMANPHYRANQADRCYHCKMELYRLLSDLARQKGYDAVLCGTNADDKADYRPGRQAAEKQDIVSPLELAGLSKDDIRTLSRSLDLPTWDKPAQPCLASRLAYGVEITPQRLQQVEKAEAFLREMGWRELRVRHHGNLARIEVPAEKIELLASKDLREKIVAFFRGIGFTYVSLDLQGFRSGSGNEVLKK